MVTDADSGRPPFPADATLALMAALQTSRAARAAHGLFVIEGVRNFVAAVDHAVPIERIVYSERLLTAPIARKLVRQLKRAGVPYARLTPEQFRTSSRTVRASGIAAIVRQQTVDLATLAPATRRCWVALRHVRAPGNFGTLLRTAAAVGAVGFVLIGDHVDPYDPAVVRASMGALSGQTLARTSFPQLAAWIRQHQLHVVGASPDGAVSYGAVAYRAPTLLLLGEERAGLTPAERALCQQLVRIPMVPGADSLNLGVAGSLLLYAIVGDAGVR